MVEEAKSNNRDKKLEADSQIEAEQLLLVLPNLLSILFGKTISPDVRQMISNFTEMALPKTTAFFGEVEEIKTTEDKPRQFIALNKVSSVFIRSIIPDVPEDKSALDYLIENLEPKTTVPPAGYLAETSYIEYRRLLSEIAQEVCSKITFTKTQEYLDSVYSAHEDILSTGQSVVTKLPIQHKVLNKARMRFTKKATESHIKIYDELAGQFEKGVAIVAGLLELLHGQSPEYLNIRKRGLANNLKKVEQSGYSILASNFDKLIRNAIAHKSYVFNPTKKTVQFSDSLSGHTRELTYREIAAITKELSALVLALNQLPTIISIEQLRDFKEMARRLEEQEPNFNGLTESL